MTTLNKEGQYYGNEREEVQDMVPTDARVILDVGCGRGIMASQLKAKRSAEVWGVEIVAEAAEDAAKRLDKVISASVEEALPQLPDNYFDVIIFADVLEHLVDPYTVLEQIREKLKPGGIVTASIPNIRHWSIFIELFEGRWVYRKEGLMDSTHLRFFTRSTIVDMFQKAGLVVQDLKAIFKDLGDLPEELLTALRNMGIDVSTLNEESKHFQYLVNAAVMSEDDQLRNRVAGLVVTAQQHLQKQEMAEALSYVEQALKEWSAKPALYLPFKRETILNLAGKLNQSLNRLGAAEERFREWLQLDDTSAEPLLALGDLALEQKEFTHAKKWYEKARAILGDNPELEKRLTKLQLMNEGNQ